MSRLAILIGFLAALWTLPVWWPVRVWVDPFSEPWGHRVG